MQGSSLYEMIIHYILSEIESGHLKPGQKIMSEKELAQKFNVSRITSKTALTQLAKDGIVKRIVGKGTYISENITLNSVRPLLDDPISPHTTDLEIGLIVPSFTDVFGTKIIHAIQRRCFELHIHLILIETCNKRNLEEEAIDRLVAHGAAGIIIRPVHGEYYGNKILNLALTNYPFVFIDRFLKGIPVSSIFTDNFAAARDLTECLINSEHTKIGFISRSVDSSSSIEERIRGFREAFSNHTLPLSSDNFYFQIHFDWHDGLHSPQQKVFQQDLSNLIEFITSHKELTAFVACEYEMAVMLQKALSVANVGHREIACFDHAPLFLEEIIFTHVLQDERAMGTLAVDMLLKTIQNIIPPEIIRVPYLIVNRESRRS